MNNLTTRKIVLGLLMTLVLAFGVHEVSDAVTIGIGDQGEPTIFGESFPRVNSTFSIPGSIVLQDRLGTGENKESFVIDISSGVVLTSPVQSTSDVTFTEKLINADECRYSFLSQQD